MPESEPTDKQKLLYYFLGLTPPVEARAWVERDIASTAWKIRRAIYLLVGFCIGIGVSVLLMGVGWASALGLAVGATIAAVIQVTVMADFLRERTLSHYRKKWNRRS